MGTFENSRLGKGRKVNTKLPRRVSEMSKETLEIVMWKKRESNTKALQIVKRLLEDIVSEEWFLECLKYISQFHFQDVIEERAITKICGYPLCVMKLKNIPNQQYRISTKCNKVYDITERKNFCSNQCYKASNYLKQQLLTSPLWLRENETIPKFQLLPVYSTSGGVGEEVDIGQTSPLKAELNQLHKQEKPEEFMSVSEFMSDSLNELVLEYDNGKTVKSQSAEDITQKNGPGAEENSDYCEKVTQSEKVRKISILETVKEAEKNSAYIEKEHRAEIDIKSGGFASNDMHDSTQNANSKEVKTIDEYVTEVSETLKEMKINANSDSSSQSVTKEQSPNVECNIAGSKNCLTDVNENTASDTKAIEKSSEVSSGCKKLIKVKKNRGNKEKPDDQCINMPSAVIHIEKCLYEWFTIESMCFLYGEEKMKEIVAEKGDSIKEYYKVVHSSSWDPKMQEQYMRICKRLNILELEDKQFENSQLATKPLPDYTVVKEEGRKMELKVRAFYQGKTAYEDAGFSSPETNTDDANVIPLVDLYAQNALRRRIVLDRLSRVLPDLLRTFGLSACDISGDVHSLVTTFALSADNITFKPSEWSLLGLIMIKMLSIKDKKLRRLLDCEQVRKYTTMMLIGFHQDSGYLERLIVWLTDLDSFLHKQR